MAELLNREAVLHVRFEGRSLDLRLTELVETEGFSDVEIKAALARRLEVSPRRFDDYVVDRHPSGNLTVRPQAVFGSR